MMALLASLTMHSRQASKHDMGRGGCCTGRSAGSASAG